jgi:hypothetical protein
MKQREKGQNQNESPPPVPLPHPLSFWFLPFSLPFALAMQATFYSNTVHCTNNELFLIFIVMSLQVYKNPYDYGKWQNWKILLGIVHGRYKSYSFVSINFI